MMNHGKLVLKNLMLNTLIELLNVPLAGQTARARNRFLVLLTDVTRELEKRRMALLHEYGELKDGELVIGEDGQYKLKDKEAFDKAFGELTTETLELPCVGEQLVTFQTVHKLLDTLETPMSVQTTSVYEEIMKAFENWAQKTA